MDDAPRDTTVQSDTSVWATMSGRSTISGQPTTSGPSTMSGQPDTSRLGTARPGPAHRIGLGFVGALLLVWAAGTTVGPGLTTTDVRTSSVAGVRDVIVDVDAGAVTLRGGSGPEVGLRMSRSWVWREPTADRSVVDGVLTVVGRCPEFGIGCRIEVQLTIPHGTTARIATGAGAIVATGLDVPVLDLQSSTGSIDVVDVSTARLLARSGARDVGVSFFRPPSVARVESGAGNVDLNVPYGRYRVDAEGATGVVIVDVIQDPGAARLLVARSSAGGVTIRSR